MTTDTAFCNKCGFIGPVAEAENHKRRDGSWCPYVATIPARRSTPPKASEAVSPDGDGLVEELEAVPPLGPLDEFLIEGDLRDRILAARKDHSQ